MPGIMSCLTKIWQSCIAYKYFLILRRLRRALYGFGIKYTEKKYGRCSDTTTNNTQDTIRTTLTYLLQPYDTSNSYTLFSTAVLSPE